MKTNELLTLLDRPATDVELLNFGNKHKLDISNVKLEPDFYRGYLEEKQEGFSLVFTDEGMFLNKPNQPFDEGSLYFSGVFFYDEGKDGYSRYQGDLPQNIKFSDTREEILIKLGEPSWQRKRRDGVIAADRWDNLDDSVKRIHITYYKDKPFPAVISIGIPDKE